MEVILLNSNEFNYTIRSFWWFQVLVALAAAGLLTLVMMLLPRKGRLVASSLTLGAGAAAWVQMLLLNGRMVGLTGDEMQVSGTEKAVNLLVWLVIIAGTVVLVLELDRKGKKAGLGMRAAAAMLTAVQLTAFVSLLLTTDFEAEGDRHIFTQGGQFELSSGTNVVEFILDASDGETVHRMLEKYPELNDQLAGWVYYPNATSEYSRTFPSLPYMLSGVRTHMDTPLKEYVDTAFDTSDFLPNLDRAQTDIRIYTMDNTYVSTHMDDIIRNVRRGENSFGDLNLWGLEKGLAKISLFKCAPYVLKPLFAYKVNILNVMAFKYKYYNNWYDPNFYRSFADRGVFTVTDSYAKAYRFYHLWGAHRGVLWNDKLDWVDNSAEGGDAAVRLRGSFMMLDAFCDEMKAHGIYDDAMIIVVADHGESVGDPETKAQYRAACPLLMIKYPGSSADRPLQVSAAPVSHDDLFATITDTLGAERPAVGSGKAVGEIREDEIRDRMYYYIALNDQVKAELLREYVIQGDAENFENWHETGNTWIPVVTK